MLEKEEEEERQNPGLEREQEHQEAQRHQEAIPLSVAVVSYACGLPVSPPASLRVARSKPQLPPRTSPHTRPRDSTAFSNVCKTQHPSRSCLPLPLHLHTHHPVSTSVFSSNNSTGSIAVVAPSSSVLPGLVGACVPFHES